MDTSNDGRSRQLRFIGGAVLVLVGLFAGILLTLWIRPSQTIAPQTEFRLVERTEPFDSLLTNDSDTKDADLLQAGHLGSVFREIARTTVESVVSIHAEPSWRIRLGYPWFESSDQSHQSAGSGVVVTAQGHIVTNYHIVEEAGRIRVLFSDKREYEAHVTGTDRLTDLAVIQIIPDVEEGSIPVIALGDSDVMMPGDWVVAVGNPFQLKSTVTAGIISALGRNMEIIDEAFGVEDFIQTDAVVNPGNSGGALVNIYGELIGVNTAIATETGYYQGYGFAIPVNLVMRVASDLINLGEVRRGYMGVTLSSVDTDHAQDLGLAHAQGVLIESVQEGGAAQRGGLQSGDVVLTAGGQRVDAPNKLRSIVAQYRPGDSVGLTVWRSGEAHTVIVNLLGADHPSVASWLQELEQQPEEEEGYASHFFYRWGLVLREKMDMDKDHFEDLPGLIVGPIVQEVETEHLQSGVLVQEINGTRMDFLEDAMRVLVDVEKAELTIVDFFNKTHVVEIERRD